MNMSSEMRTTMLATLRRLHESPDAKEEALKVEHQLARNDSELRDFLKLTYLDEDRAEAKARFDREGIAEDVIAAIRHHFGDRKDIAICEIGGGSGFLSAYLAAAGYSDVDLLEPASGYHSGTGFIRTQAEADRFNILNSIDDWYASPKQYDLFITFACIHHFHNPVVVASQMRLKAKNGAPWLAFMEFFSADYEHMMTQITEHRHAALYGLYEWPYSVRLYRNMLAAGGWQCTAVSAAAPYASYPMSPFLTAWRMFWRVAVALRAGAIAHRAFVLAVRLINRGLLAKTGANYMAFRAAPINWDRVPVGYLGGDKSMLPNWRPTTVRK